MNRRNCIPLLLLLPTLVLSACGRPAAADLDVRAEATRLASAQLGQLADRLTDQERAQILLLLEELVPLRQARAQENRWALSDQEAELVAQLNELYEDCTHCTQRYLEEPQVPDGDEEPPTLAQYDIEKDGRLTPVEGDVDAYQPL